jgi:hypothetical protein
MGPFERFKTKTHFNSLKRLVGITALAALAVKLLAVALATAAGGGTPLDLLARVPASLADLGAALLVFEVLRSRRPLQLAARSAILVAVSPVLFVASGIHGDPVAVAVALLLAMYLLVDRDAPLVAGTTLALASRVEPMALLAAPMAMAAVTAPGGDGPRARPGGRALPAAPLRRGAGRGPAGRLGADPGLALAVLPAVVWVRRRPRRVYAAVGLVLLAPPGPGPGVVAAGPGLAGRVRLPGRRPLGQHLRHGRRGHPAVDLDLVGGRPALARRRRPRDRARRHRGRPGPGHLGGARLLAGPGLAHGGGRGGRRGPGDRGPGDQGPATRVAVDNPGHPVTRSATLPPGGLDPGRGRFGAPGHGVEPVGPGTSPSRGL